MKTLVSLFFFFFFFFFVLSMSAFADCRSYSFFQATENSEPKRIELTHTCVFDHGEACVYLDGKDAVIHGINNGYRIVGNDLFNRKVRDNGEILEITMKTKFPISMYYSRTILFELHKSSGTAYMEYSEKGSDPYEMKVHLKCSK